MGKLRQIEVLIGQGKASTGVQGGGDHCADLLPVEYGGLQPEQARRLKDLQKENAELRRAVADLTVDKPTLKDIAQGNF